VAKYLERGLEQRHEQDQRMLIRDTRTLGQRFHDFFADAFNGAVVIVCFAVAMIFFPMFADLLFLLAIFLFIFSYTRKNSLPFRLPQVAKRLDFNDPKAGSNQPQMARGICFLGNDRNTNEELWFSNEDMRTHMLIFGSTGSGKTVTLVGLAYNALVHGSGFIYVDGKGDNSLFAQVFSMARSMGREDDVLLVNFMTGARDIVGAQEKRLSNTMNPFARGSSSMLSQLVVGLMGSSSKSSDGDMWKGRAIAFVEALMKILVYMRDADYILLDANSIRNYFHLPKLESIALDKQFPRDNQEPISLEGVPDVVMEPIKNYLATLPGFDPAKKGKQVSQVLEQHGFITMQLVRAFGSLADTYGHILRTNLAEVDLNDVVLNRRILVVLLPALEKAPDELANLGKIIISTLKAMMSAGLGSGVEGTYTELIQRKPTNAPTPFMCILDEYGYYAVEGFAVVPAQARSLGFSTIFAGQDLPAFQKASKEEAASIGANTNIKICMKLEDPIETWEFFNKTAGESFVTKVDAFQTDPNSLTNTYRDTRSSSAEKRARIDLLDLKEQREGEFHVFFKSKIIRGRTFYAAPQPVKYMRLTHHLKVEPPPTRMLVELEKRETKFSQFIDGFSPDLGEDPSAEEIAFIINATAGAKDKTLIEKSVNVLLEYHKENTVVEEEQAQVAAAEEELLSSDELNIFAPMRLSDPTVPMLVGAHFEAFASPLLVRSDLLSKIELAERLSGRSSKNSMNVATELLSDMQIGTHYPPFVSLDTSVNDMVTLINDLTAHVKKRVTEEAGKAEESTD
jgi:intracellular multiplication protein IcmO